MNHFNDDDDEDDQQLPHLPQGFPQGGFPNFFAQLAGMGAGAGGMPLPPWATGALGHGAVRTPPRAFDEYLKAYSVAVMEHRGDRDELKFGGKIIMPPSSLAALTRLDIEAPWMFKLTNPSNSAASTHAGVLEFIAPEGQVFLPQWMMNTLRLDEGDPIRITGAKLPKGKFVKIQAQSVLFLELSDPKAVLEQALRNFICLTEGDIIEISYNGIPFEILVMEIKPEGAGITVLDTDLEVDFAAPKGYVEPTRPEPKPVPTMAEKLNIDTNASERPPSAALGAADFEAFKGMGQALNGRRTKGKGRAGRKIQEVDEHSKIIRTDKPRMVTADAYDGSQTVPAPLNLPFGRLFFGYPIVPLRSAAAADPLANAPSAGAGELPVFSGSGHTLSGRGPRARREESATPSVASGSGSGSGEVKEEDKWKGKGRALGGRQQHDVIEID